MEIFVCTYGKTLDNIACGSQDEFRLISDVLNEIYLSRKIKSNKIKNLSDSWAQSSYSNTIRMSPKNWTLLIEELEKYCKLNPRKKKIKNLLIIFDEAVCIY